MLTCFHNDILPESDLFFLLSTIIRAICDNKKSPAFAGEWF